MLVCTYTQTHQELTWHGTDGTGILFLHVCTDMCVCQKMLKDCLCLFPKQVQMYVVVGLRFECHGLYCLS